jgi:hypothetical protein
VEVDLPLLARRSLTTRVQRGRGRLAHFRQPIMTVGLMVLTAVAGALISKWPMQVPWGSFTPIAVIAGLFLTLRALLVLDAFLLLVAGWVGLGEDLGKPAFLGAYVVLVVVMVAMFWVATSRARLGVQGN